MLGTSISELIRTKEHDSKDMFEFYKNRIDSHNKTLNAYISVENEPNSQISGVLNSLPIAVKDNIATKNKPTTASADILKSYTSPYVSTVVKKLYSAGATLLGKTNLDAWAHGSSTETSDFGPSLNPYNTEYVPGGSSGGSAVAVAAGLAPAAIGTETAGSVRLPAAWSGIVGMKPSYGRVSRYGIVAMGSSWDCPSPMTQTVEDAALLLTHMAGKDTYDASSVDKPVENYTNAIKDKNTYVIGVSDDYMNNLDDDVAKAVESTLKTLEDLGHTIKSVDLIDPSISISVYMLLQRSEVSSNLARYDGIRYGKNRSHFGEEAERRIMLGTYALSSGYYDAYYKKAQKVRYRIREDFEKAFSDVDLIFAPTTPRTATKLGDSADYAFYGEMMDKLTEPASAAGIPAISIPHSLDRNGLPIGVQFMGKAFNEADVLNAAHYLEKELQFDRLSVMKKYE